MNGQLWPPLPQLCTQTILFPLSMRSPSGSLHPAAKHLSECMGGGVGMRPLGEHTPRTSLISALTLGSVPWPPHSSQSCFATAAQHPSPRPSALSGCPLLIREPPSQTPTLLSCFLSPRSPCLPAMSAYLLSVPRLPHENVSGVRTSSRGAAFMTAVSVQEPREYQLINE